MTNTRRDDGLDVANTRQESNPTSSSGHMVDNRSDMTNTRQDDGLDVTNTRQESNPTSSSSNMVDDRLDMKNTRQESNLTSSSSNKVLVACHQAHHLQVERKVPTELHAIIDRLQN